MTTKQKAFQAYSKHGNVVRDTPRKAAHDFFLTFPKARKCNVSEGEVDGQYFITVMSQSTQRYRDVTKATVCTLPDTQAHNHV
jgi:hypothetical protein